MAKIVLLEDEIKILKSLLKKIYKFFSL